jgi:hypothetical protein
MVYPREVKPMRNSALALLMAFVLAAVLLGLGLVEGRSRQKKAETIETLEKRIDDLEQRVQKLEGKPKG